MKASHLRLFCRNLRGYGLFVLVASLGLPACQLPEGLFGGREPSVSPATVVETKVPEMGFLPTPLRPTAEEFAQVPPLAEVVQMLSVGNWAPAAVRLQSIKPVLPQSSRVHALHIWVLAHEGGLDAGQQLAEDGFASFEEKGPFAYSLAVILREKGAFAAALPWYQQALAAYPSEAPLLRESARCAWSAGQSDRCLAFLDQIMLLEQLSDEDLLLRARSLQAEKRLEAASATFERLLIQNPGDLDLMLEQAGCLLEAGQYYKCISLLKELVGLDPQSAEAHLLLGHASARDLDPYGAESAFQRALELQPGHLAAGKALSKLLVNSNRRDEAIEVLNRLLRQPLASADVERVQAWLIELDH